MKYVPYGQVLDIIPRNQIHPLVPVGYERAEFAQLPGLGLGEIGKVAVNDLEIEPIFGLSGDEARREQ